MMKAGTPYDFIGEYKALSKSDRAVLHGAVGGTDALVVTDRGSDNERFCKMLSEVYCTAPAVLPGHFPQDRLSGWRVTPLGQEALPTLFQQSNGDTASVAPTELSRDTTAARSTRIQEDATPSVRWPRV